MLTIALLTIFNMTVIGHDFWSALGVACIIRFIAGLLAACIKDMFS